MRQSVKQIFRGWFFSGAVALVAAWISTGTARADQVIADDLIVDGSVCVGFDCVNGESFGFDTIRIKENNLRIKAVDTSNTSSFPSNDWQITFNDTSNGGANKFSIDDIDGGRTPFTIEAGAPSHSLYVDDGGRLGLGTSTPVADIHVKSGNTPTLRLEQDGTSGFTPQTWDVAGNEAGFFVRDATGGSTLPLRIRPTAPSSSIDIAADGDVGMGTASPSAKLHVNTAAGGAADLIRLTNDGFVKVVFENTAGSEWVMGHAADDFRLTQTGGTPNPFVLDGSGNLTVKGSYKVNATTLTVPDYVFEPDYELMPIGELDRFVRAEKHLPRVPSADDVKQTGGVNMTDLQMRLLEKVEELTLYTIDQHKTIEDQRAALDDLKQRLGHLEQVSKN